MVNLANDEIFVNNLVKMLNIKKYKETAERILDNKNQVKNALAFLGI